MSLHRFNTLGYAVGELKVSDNKYFACQRPTGASSLPRVCLPQALDSHLQIPNKGRDSENKVFSSETLFDANYIWPDDSFDSITYRAHHHSCRLQYTVETDCSDNSSINPYTARDWTVSSYQHTNIPLSLL